MGIELELSVLLFILGVGMTIFGRFEVERPVWRGLLKWSVLCGGTVALYGLAGHWSLIFPLLALVFGGTVHVVWCRRNGIHPLYATPRRRYYQLRGWEWPSE